MADRSLFHQEGRKTPQVPELAGESPFNADTVQTDPSREKLRESFMIFHQTGSSPKQDSTIELDTRSSISTADLELSSVRVGKFRSLRDGLGAFGAASIFGGGLVLLGVLAFLLFLWMGEGPNDGAQAPLAWQRIVFGQLTTQAVTLASVVLRFIISIQAVVCTSLLAAVVLERHGVARSHVAQLSVTRSVNDGPLKLAWLLISKTRRPFLPTFVASWLLAASVAVQFSSTLLVSDLVTAPVVQAPTAESRAVYMTTMQSQANSDNFILQKPLAYMPFGEIASGVDPTPTQSGLSDTGIVRRVFLPFSAAERATLRSYKGKGFTYHSRFVCMPPSMDAIIQIIQEPDNLLNPVDIVVAGTMDYEKSLAAAGVAMPTGCPAAGCFASAFNCSMPSFDIEADKAFYGDEVSAVCQVSGQNAVYTAANTTLSQETITPYSQVFLVSRNNGTFNGSWVGELNGQEVSLKGNVSLTTGIPPVPVEEWARVVFPNDVVFDFSLCFQEAAYDLSDVTVSTPQNLKDAVLTWNATQSAWNTSAVENMMGTLAYAATSGAEPTNATDNAVQPPINTTARGIFAVESLSNGTSNRNTELFFELLVVDTWFLNALTNVSIVGFLTPPAAGFQYMVPQVDYSALYTNTLRSTGRPTLALQSVMTAMTSSMMAELQPQYDTNATVSVVSSVNALVPGRFRGLLAVYAIVLVHLVCVASISVMFLRTTQYSSQGNYWHAVAQVMSEETRLLVQHATQETDDGIGRLVEVDDPEMRLARREKTNRVEVARMDDPMLS